MVLSYNTESRIYYFANPRLIDLNTKVIKILSISLIIHDY